MEHSKSKSNIKRRKDRNTHRGPDEAIDDSEAEAEPLSRGQAASLAAVFIVPLILLMLYGIYGG